MRVHDHIFISYSHEDTKWLQLLLKYLKPLERDGKIVRLAWDGLIEVGQNWYDEIQGYLASARVAVLMVSQSFLASEFIYREELPPILEKAEEGELVLFWCLVRPCLYRDSPLWEYQAAHDPSRAWSELSEPELERLLVKISGRLQDVLKGLDEPRKPAQEEYALAREQAQKPAMKALSGEELARAARRLAAGHEEVGSEESYGRARALLADVWELDLIEQMGSLFALGSDWPNALYAYDRLVERATPRSRRGMAVGYEQLGIIYQKGELPGCAEECWRLSRNLYHGLGLSSKVEEIERRLNSLGGS